MNMISLYMNYCKLHFLFIFAHIDLEINLIDISSIEVLFSTEEKLQITKYVRLRINNNNNNGYF